MKKLFVLDELKNIRIEDYTYDLPDERIAKFPLEERDASKLLIYNEGQIGEKRFSATKELLQAGQSLVFNNTKVIHARIFLFGTSRACGLCPELCCPEYV